MIDKSTFVATAGLCALLAACQDPMQGSYPGVSYRRPADAGEEEQPAVDSARDFHLPDLPRFSDALPFLDVIATPYDQAHPAEEGGYVLELWESPDAGQDGGDALVEYDGSSPNAPFPPEGYIPPFDAGSEVYDGNIVPDWQDLSIPPEACAAYDLPGNAVDEDCDGSLACPVPCEEDESSQRAECGDGIGGWRTHGMYVSCVAHYANDLYRNGTISTKERAAMVEEAAQSEIGKRL